MICAEFLDKEIRKELEAILKDGKAETRVTRRANALLLLDDGLSCEEIARVLYLDDDTIRYWRQKYQEKGLKWLEEFGYKGHACEMTATQQDALKAWVTQTLPRTTTQVGEWIEKRFGISYTRSALVKVLKRLEMVYRRPKPLSSKMDPAKQADFIASYEKLLNSLDEDETVVFADATHPTHEARPAGCWAPKGEKVAIEQTSGRSRLNVHGAIDLETGKTQVIDVPVVNAESTISLLNAIETAYPNKRQIHVFLDNARYHHAKSVQEWLKRPKRRVVLHFVPAYCPHLNPIERLWGLMHRNITHNRCYGRFKDFSGAILNFLRDDVPKRWRIYRDSVTDNFRVVNPANFRVL